MMAEMRIGTLPEEERVVVATDPYSGEPERDKSIVARNRTPFNGEPPKSALLSHITPTHLHFKRNHMPVPTVLPEAYELQARAAAQYACPCTQACHTLANSCSHLHGMMRPPAWATICSALLMMHPHASVTYVYPGEIVMDQQRRVFACQSHALHERASEVR
jgi:hypothetical protein